MISRIIFLLLIIFPALSGAQGLQGIDTIQPAGSYNNIYTRHLYSDSLSSSFVIFIKEGVKAHKHLEHTEHVYILQGTGEMLLGDKKIKIKKEISSISPKELRIR